jgi:hypothetical protein
VRKSVAREGKDSEAAQSRCFESKPVANVVETDRMGKLGKNIAATWLKTLKVRAFASTPVFRAV